MSRPLEDQLGDVMAALDEHRRKLAEVRDELAARSCTVRSRDRMLSVTVGAGGRMAGMQFHTSAYAGMAPAQLARVVTETVQQAQAQLAGEVAAAMEPYRGVGKALRESMVGGTDADAALAPVYAARDEMRHGQTG